MADHTYAVSVTWTGNRGGGTTGYTEYDRDHVLGATNKPEILGSADPAFRGDPGRWNPEDLLVGALSACHKLWYLHLGAVNGIAVLAYEDTAQGTMVTDPARGGWFTGVVLRPRVTVPVGCDEARAASLHAEAHAKCFIANSVNFPVTHEATIVSAAAG